MIKPSHLEIAQNTVTQIDFHQAFSLITHSIVVGSILMLTTALIGIQNSNRTPTKAPPASTPPTKFDSILNASNVLYMCLGMTGIMVLVSDSIARAFAIGAAIAIVRFRIKVDSKSFGMCLFYGVLAGMACGVDHVPLAYAMAIIFSLLQVCIFSLAYLVGKKSEVTLTKALEEVPLT